eukprot:TRINITY_DN3707_c0_g1_i1.p1 TRINITY_DN3707_c0_g1~~TRINITY_DN3707_c0_g1_i1.p1  ORF type:complete len:331 (+),score=86.59 TRINITY_DN3707_c0_g1_i1:261-1253(+)
MSVELPTITRHVFPIDVQYFKQSKYFPTEEEQSSHVRTAYDSDCGHSNVGSDDDTPDSPPSIESSPPEPRFFAPPMFSSKPKSIGIKRSHSESLPQKEKEYEIAEMLLSLGTSDCRPSSPSTPPTSPSQPHSGSDDEDEYDTEGDFDEEIEETEENETEEFEMEESWEGDAYVEEDEDDDWQVANPPTKISRRKAPSGTACEKHKKWKKRCPADCPNRKRAHVPKSNSSPPSGKKSSAVSSPVSPKKVDAFTRYKGRYNPPELTDSIYEETFSSSRRSTRNESRSSPKSSDYTFDNDEVISSKRRYLVGACERHRAQHTRCPPECPYRKN